MRSLDRMFHCLCRSSFPLFLFLALAGASVRAETYLNFEGKLTRPICLSPDGTRLFAVNTADARLSVFDLTHPLNPFLIAEIPVGIEPVSVNARNNDEAWVSMKFPIDRDLNGVLDTDEPDQPSKSGKHPAKPS